MQKNPGSDPAVSDRDGQPGCDLSERPSSPNEDLAAFLERTERDIEEKKTVLDEAEDTNGDHDKAQTEDEEEKKKDRNKPRMCL